MTVNDATIRHWRPPGGCSRGRVPGWSRFACALADRDGSGHDRTRPVGHAARHGDPNSDPNAHRHSPIHPDSAADGWKMWIVNPIPGGGWEMHDVR